MDNQSEDISWIIRPVNTKFVKNSPECQQIIEKLKEIQIFLGQYGFLTFRRSGILWFSNQKPVLFSTNNVMTSLELTMGSIIACCEDACIADANTLLRKYRDDIFFYLYIYACNSLEANSSQAKKMKFQIEKWLNNNLKDFFISDVLKDITTIPKINDVVTKYNLKDSFKNIANTLNNYVHSNGYAYYNRNVNSYKPGKLLLELKHIGEVTKYTTMVFLLLLIICSPTSVMSEDYMDYLDFNDIPPKESEYWVATFVEDFVKKNISIIDKNCLHYLRQNTKMQL